MVRLENVTKDDLHQILAEVEGKQPTLRVLTGINYKDGVAQTALADRYDVSRNTIRNWLDRLERLEDEPFEDVVYDAPRSGRPSDLTDKQTAQLKEALHNPPREAGVNAPAWTPLLAQQYIEDQFGVQYHLRHIRRLMNEAGLTELRISYRTAERGCQNTEILAFDLGEDVFPGSLGKCWVI